MLQGECWRTGGLLRQPPPCSSGDCKGETKNAIALCKWHWGEGRGWVAGSLLLVR